MSSSEVFLMAMIIILAVPYFIWRLGRTEHYAPLVVVQIVTGIVLGPGVLGAWNPEFHAALFSPAVIGMLNGIAWWAVMCFVWVAGIELDLRSAWTNRRESTITAGLALSMPLVFGSAVAVLIARAPGWLGRGAMEWQFVLGVGMSCAVTALPILILFMERLDILRRPIGQRILRYASIDDIAIWAVLALILMDWRRVRMQMIFLAALLCVGCLLRALMKRIPARDRWYAGLIWLTVVSFAAEYCGLHFMVGAFLAGAMLDREWFEQRELDEFRRIVLMVMMPVFFLSTGLRTTWALGGSAVFVVAGALLLASVGGKLAGIHLAGRILGWAPGEASFIGWLLQTKASIMIIFASVLLDKQLITADAFTALLLMAVASTMLTIPVVSPMLKRVGLGH